MASLIVDLLWMVLLIVNMEIIVVRIVLPVLTWPTNKQMENLLSQCPFLSIEILPVIKTNSFPENV